MSGQKFGDVTVLSPRPGNDAMWNCRCKCGAELIRRPGDLRADLKRGRSLICSGTHRKQDKATLIGQRFGSLVVVSRATPTVSGYLWDCRCDCGGEVQRITSHLRQSTQRTGCKQCQAQRFGEIHITHGGALRGVSRLYGIWKGMLKRCRDKTDPIYGGKGIQVCEQWQDFRAFRAWALDNGYAPGLTIERRNSALGYNSSNCEWITRNENSRRAQLGRRKERLAA